MAGDRVTGLAEVYALIDKLPDAARKELGAELPDIGQDILAAERRDVAKRTGALSAGLGVQFLVDRLRLRVGLLGLRGANRRLYYGLIVEAGRKAHVVLVDRKRRAKGRARAAQVASTYAMRVTPLAARPFVHVVRPALDQKIAGRLANFWANTFDRAGAAA